MTASGGASASATAAAAASGTESVTAAGESPALSLAGRGHAVHVVPRNMPIHGRARPSWRQHTFLCSFTVAALVTVPAFGPCPGLRVLGRRDQSRR